MPSAGIGFLLILKRMPVFVVLFGCFGYGVSYLVQRYLPDLIQEFQIKKDKTVPVDITLSEENPHKSDFLEDRGLTQDGNDGKYPIFSDANTNKNSDQLVKDAGNDMGKNSAESYDKSAKIAQVIRNVINREE